MKIYDVTWPMSPEMPVWPGSPQVQLARLRSMDKGERNNLSILSCSVHTGTHMDAPVHFLADGTDITTLPLEIMMGPARVIELPDVDTITAASLEKCDLKGITRLLYKTRNSALSRDVFHRDFVYMTLDAADWVVAHGIRLIGADYLGIEIFGSDGSVHRRLLAAGVVIVEGLDLIHVPPGDYTFHGLPLKLAGSDGSPVRAVLVKE